MSSNHSSEKVRAPKQHVRKAGWLTIPSIYAEKFTSRGEYPDDYMDRLNSELTQAGEDAPLYSLFYFTRWRSTQKPTPGPVRKVLLKHTFPELLSESQISKRDIKLTAEDIDNLYSEDVLPDAKVLVDYLKEIGAVGRKRKPNPTTVTKLLRYLSFKE